MTALSVGSLVLLLVGVLSLTGCNSGPKVDRELLSAAYDACTTIIRAGIMSTMTKEDISFSRDSRHNFAEGDEFYFAFSSGDITNARRVKPDVLTGSTKPSASCIGQFSIREITSVTINGADAIRTPQGF